MTKLFISYSRKDRKFAEGLVARFAQQQADVWIDWEDIPPSRDWWEEIKKGIEEADVIIFLVSPDSIASKVCKQEIEHALLNGKRLVPVIVRDVNLPEVPAEISRLNWIFFRETDDFEESYRKLDIAIHTDFEWVRTQSEIQVKALKWERHAFEKSFLLRGRELRDTERWFQSTAGKDPIPTELQVRYLRKSRELIDRQRKSSMVGLASLVVVALGYYVWQDRTWFRVWPIPQACPNITTAVVEVLPTDIMQETGTFPDDFLDIESETDLRRCRTNKEDKMGVVRIEFYSPPSDEGYNFAITLPPIPAYQMDFLPELRYVESAGSSKEDAVELLRAATAYSVGNYEDVVKGLDGTATLAGKILLAQAYLFENDLEKSRTAYREAIELADLHNMDSDQLLMGYALSWWYFQMSDQVRSNPGLYEQNQVECENSFEEYAKALSGAEANNDWLLIADIGRYYCWQIDNQSPPPVLEATGNAYRDFLSGVLLIRTDKPSEYRNEIENLLLSSRDDLSQANLELSKYYAHTFEDCSGYQEYMRDFRESVFTEFGKSLVRYYYRTESCWP